MPKCQCQYMMRTRLLDNMTGLADKWSSDNFNTRAILKHSHRQAASFKLTGQNNSAALGFHGQECSLLSGVYLFVYVCAVCLFVYLCVWVSSIAK